MFRKWFSLPLKVWLVIVMGSVLVALLIPRHQEPARPLGMGSLGEPPSRPSPNPGADPMGQGGILLRAGNAPPLRVVHEGASWEIGPAHYSQNDNQFEPMIRHIHSLRGRYFASEAVPLPHIDAVPHIRVTLRMSSRDGWLDFRLCERLLLQDQLGFWHPPITDGGKRRDDVSFDIGLTYYLPPRMRPAALGWRTQEARTVLAMYYRGGVYAPDFTPGDGKLYVATNAAGEDDGYLGVASGLQDQIETRGGRFYLAGVDMREWTERHKKDRGFGGTKVLVRFPQRAAARKAATSSAQ